MKAGEIVAAGDQVDDLQLGMQAVVHPWISWGECLYCQIDKEKKKMSTVQELRALVELIVQTRMSHIPIQKCLIHESNQAFVDLQQGKVTRRLNPLIENHQPAHECPIYWGILNENYILG